MQNNLDDRIILNIIEWDSVNWAIYLNFIDYAKIDFEGKRVLALGERNGGMSFVFALKGAEVICSDAPISKARRGKRVFFMRNMGWIPKCSALVNKNWTRKLKMCTTCNRFRSVTSQKKTPCIAWAPNGSMHRPVIENYNDVEERCLFA